MFSRRSILPDTSASGGEGQSRKLSSRRTGMWWKTFLFLKRVQRAQFTERERGKKNPRGQRAEELRPCETCCGEGVRRNVFHLKQQEGYAWLSAAAGWPESASGRPVWLHTCRGPPPPPPSPLHKERIQMSAADPFRYEWARLIPPSCSLEHKNAMH